MIQIHFQQFFILLMSVVFSLCITCYNNGIQILLLFTILLLTIYCMYSIQLGTDSLMGREASGNQKDPVRPLGPGPGLSVSEQDNWPLTAPQALY